MGESSDSNSLLADLVNKSKHHEITSTSPSIDGGLVESSMEEMEGGSFDGGLVESSIEEVEGGSLNNRIAKGIEKSKSHWSQVREFDVDNEVAEVSNVELFQTLQKHPTWGTFFVTFGEVEGSFGELVMGKKFAEGGQAELYEVQIKWNHPSMNEFDQKSKQEYVLKVFKKGSFLRHLQSQWPQGMLQSHANMVQREKLGLPQKLRFYCGVNSATLLEDGRFAFVMEKEENDLRSLIDEFMLTRLKGKGPFSKHVVEFLMYQIAYGMDQLHNQGIVHRDIKASNVLFTRGSGCFIADFECSVGVVGTGFFRAPEILEACKNGNVNNKAELFTKAVDVYGYGMTCYEILTGKNPFEGHPKTEYDFVLDGQTPELPKDVDVWIRKLLKKCWQLDPLARPSFGAILKILLANSSVCRKEKLLIERKEVELGIRKESKMAKLKRPLKTMKLILLCLI